VRITSIGLKIFERHELRQQKKDRAAAAGGGGKGGGGAAAGGATGAAAATAGGSGAAAGGGGGGGGGAAVGELERSCHYRIVQEGLPFILPHITKQVRAEGAAWQGARPLQATALGREAPRVPGPPRCP
jgi:hypothetical protein